MCGLFVCNWSWCKINKKRDTCSKTKGKLIECFAPLVWRATLSKTYRSFKGTIERGSFWPIVDWF